MHRFVPTDRLDATALPWQISLRGSRSSQPGCTGSPVICTPNLWGIFPVTDYQSPSPLYKLWCCCVCDVCVFKAGAIFTSQQEPHRKAEVPHTWNIDARWQRERTKAGCEYEYTYMRKEHHIILSGRLLGCIFSWELFKPVFHMQREHLTEVILRLLGAWDDPLSQLHRSMSRDQNQDFNHYSSNKALEMSDMAQELRDGVLKIAEKVRSTYVCWDFRCGL